LVSRNGYQATFAGRPNQRRSSGDYLTALDLEEDQRIGFIKETSSESLQVVGENGNL